MILKTSRLAISDFDKLRCVLKTLSGIRKCPAARKFPNLSIQMILPGSREIQATTKSEAFGTLLEVRSESCFFGYTRMALEEFSKINKHIICDTPD